MTLQLVLSFRYLYMLCGFLVIQTKNVRQVRQTVDGRIWRSVAGGCIVCALRLGLPCAGDTAGRLSTLDHLPFPPDGDFSVCVGGHGLDTLET